MVVKPEWLNMGGPAAVATLASFLGLGVLNLLGGLFALGYVRRGPKNQRVERRVRYLVNRASTLYEVGDYDGALRLLSKALATCRGAGDREGEADQLSNVGLVLNRKGDYDGAVGYFERALEKYRGAGDAVGVANQMAHLSLARERLEIAGAELKVSAGRSAAGAEARERVPVRVRRADA
jgi:tetratricopeptide (TPR) repeat protein